MYVGFGAILVLLLVMAGFSYYEITETKNTYEKLLNDRVEKINIVRNMLEETKEIELANRGYLLIGNDESLASYEVLWPNIIS